MYGLLPVYNVKYIFHLSIENNNTLHKCFRALYSNAWIASCLQCEVCFSYLHLKQKYFLSTFLGLCTQMHGLLPVYSAKYIFHLYIENNNTLHKCFGALYINARITSCLQ